MSATTSTITGEIADLLIADGWTYRWMNTPNHLGDEYGNTVAIYDTGEPEEPIKVEFEYALPGGSVETLHLDPTRGAHRIAVVISALAMPI